MTNTLLVLLAIGGAFGVGVFVGKPPQVVVAERQVEVCVVSTSGSSISEGAKHIEASRNTLEKHETKSESSSSEPSSSSSSSSSETETAGVKYRKIEDDHEDAESSDELPIADGNKWAASIIKQSVRHLGVYGSRSTRYSFTSQELIHLETLKSHVAAANLLVYAEGPMAVGKYVYFIDIKAINGAPDEEQQ